MHATDFSPFEMCLFSKSVFATLKKQKKDKKTLKEKKPPYITLRISAWNFGAWIWIGVENTTLKSWGDPAGLSEGAQPRAKAAWRGRRGLAQRVSWPGEQQLEACATCIGIQKSFPLAHPLPPSWNAFLKGLCEFGDTKVASWDWVVAFYPYVYSIVCTYFTRPLGLIPRYLCFSFLYTLYFSDKGTPHWCDVPLFLPSVVSTLVPTSWQCVCFLWRPLPIKDEIKCCLSWSLLWFLIFVYSLFEIIILLST